MNVLVITDLYPGSSRHSVKDITWAVHELVQGLNIANINVVKVIRPVREIHWKFFSRRKIFKVSNMDGLIIETKSFINLPRKGFYLTKSDLKYFKKNLKNVDLIISHMSFGAQLSDVVFKKFNINYLYIMHENDFHSLDRQLNLFKHALGIYTRSWALNLKLANFGIESNGIIFSGIDEKLINFSCHHIGLNKKLKFISVNRLEKRKNIDVTLKVLAKLPSKYKWEYTIIGDGTKKDELNNLILNLGITEQVNMLGFQNRSVCIDKMKESDIFIMPSDPETFGLVYLEAMASNCIVVCASNSGVDGLIENEVSGYVVEARNESKLKNVLIQLFEKDQSKVLTAAQDIIQNYTLRKAQNNYSNLIKGAFSRLGNNIT